MRRVLVALVLMFGVVLAQSRPAAAEAEALFATFDARELDPAETRLLQTALAATGDYRGGLDGLWDAASQRAIEAYAAREYTDMPLGAHAAVLVLEFAEVVARDGWEFVNRPELGLSFALPLAVLEPWDSDAGEARWQRRTGGLTVLAFAGDAAEAASWHDAVLGDLAPRGARIIERGDGRLITAGTSADGWLVHLRSERVAGGWSTLSLEAAPGAEGVPTAWLDLVAASLRSGPPLDWDLPLEGRLAAMVDAAIALAEAAPELAPDSEGTPGFAAGVEETSSFAADAGPALAVFAGPAPDASAGVATFAGDAPQAAVTFHDPAHLPQALPPPEAAMQGAGTGFYLGDRLIVTAEHVIAGCAAVTLRDGSPLELLASDADLDVAALAAPGPARSWLMLAAGDPVRLGQPVHALGFPYYALAGTSLNLTSGNVSALAGIDDDRRFFSFSAPVQPGNSGGPLIDRAGAVAGLVVARLSESFIADATGTLPQNVNYALSTDELLDFLERNGVAAAEGGIGGFDMGEGAPPEIGQAIVPILCH